MDDFSFSDNQQGHRFELKRDGAVAAHADYKIQDNAVVLTHTEVLPGHEGKGVGSRLAKLVLADLRQRGATIVPQCSFMASYIAKHPAS